MAKKPIAWAVYLDRDRPKVMSVTSMGMSVMGVEMVHGSAGASKKYSIHRKRREVRVFDSDTKAIRFCRELGTLMNQRNTYDKKIKSMMKEPGK